MHLIRRHFSLGCGYTLIRIYTLIGIYTLVGIYTINWFGLLTFFMSFKLFYQI